MEVLVYLLMFFVTFGFVVLMANIFFYKNILVKERLNAIKATSVDLSDDNELKEPFIKRIIEPIYKKTMKSLGNAAPTAIKTKYEDIILASGGNKKLTFNSVLLNQIVMMFIYGMLIFAALVSTNGKINLILILLGATLGFVSPVLLLYSKASKRKEKIKKALPDFLDLLYVSVEAGLGMDLALKRASEKMKGPLSEEILKTLNEIAKGRVREEALKGLANRTGVKELNVFVTAIIQTEQLGSDIANMLRVQSVTMRESRRQRAEELAAKIPVKMMFPLIFLMFPFLFVVILGPAIISIFENFSSVKW